MSRDQKGKFEKGTSGNPGGVSTSRKHLNESMIGRLRVDFERYGIRAIARVRRQDPVQYLKIIVALLPKQVEHGGHIEHDVSHSGEVTVSETTEFIAEAIGRPKDRPSQKLDS